MPTKAALSLLNWTGKGEKILWKAHVLRDHTPISIMSQTDPTWGNHFITNKIRVEWWENKIQVLKHLPTTPPSFTFIYLLPSSVTGGKWGLWSVHHSSSLPFLPPQWEDSSCPLLQWGVPPLGDRRGTTLSPWAAPGLLTLQLLGRFLLLLLHWPWHLWSGFSHRFSLPSSATAAERTEKNLFTTYRIWRGEHEGHCIYLPYQIVSYIGIAVCMCLFQAQWINDLLAAKLMNS